MPKFRHKPIEIEAFRAKDALLAASKDWKALPKWLAEAYERGKVLFGNSQIQLQQSNGTWAGAGADDWIICGIKGELYPCPDSVLQQAYDPL